MKPNYAYALPHRIKEFGGSSQQVEIITQKSSFTMKNNELFAIVRDLLLFIEQNPAFKAIGLHFHNKISDQKIQEILTFLHEHEVVFLSEEPVSRTEKNLIVLLAQYTNSLQKYSEKLKSITFCIYADGDQTGKFAGLLEHLGLSYKYVSAKQLPELTERDFLLAAADSTRMYILDEIHEVVSGREGCLWAFVLFYSDSFMISPILNQKDYIGYSCLRDQLQLPQGQHGISENVLLENMGVNELLLEVLTSLTKLNIKTSYGKAIIFNSADRTVDVERVYYLPRFSPKKKAVYLRRWDGEK